MTYFIDPYKKYPVESEEGTYYLKSNIQCEEKISIEELFNDKTNLNDNNEIS